MYVYIAGPMTIGNRIEHMRTAINIAKRLMDRGHVPFIPNLSDFVNLVYPIDYEVWMKQDFAWILKCDAVLRIPGESFGADREVTFAIEHEKLVFFGLEAFMTSQYWDK